MLTNESATRKDMAAGKSGMERRHFATIATILLNIGADAAACEQWADELAPTNPRFDRARFLRACRG